MQFYALKMLISLDVFLDPASFSPIFMSLQLNMQSEGGQGGIPLPTFTFYFLS